MKVMGLWPALLAATLLSASAQVSVEISTDQEQFLPSESMPLAIRITNRSGQDLHLGEGPDWLTFSVESRDSEIIPKIGEVPVAGPFVLESSRVATLRVDVAPYFALSRPGRYTITATARLQDWNQNVTSPPKGFDIIQGARLWEQEVGVPNTSDVNARPEVRKFILQQANYLKTQLRLYVRVTDQSGARTFRVFPIGPVVSFGRPESQVDKFSNLHVLSQDGPRSFIYTVVNPDGEVIARRTYDLAERRPHLQPDAEGKILVMGGVRRPTSRDIPPDKSSDASGKETKPGPAPGEMMLPDF